MLGFDQFINLPLDNDYSWVQLLTGIHWLIASLIAFTIRFERKWHWILFSCFLFFCALDELFMVHECFKYGYSFFRPEAIGDIFIFTYGIMAIFGAIYFYLHLMNNKKQKIILLLMLIFTALIVANDVFGLSFFSLKNSAEECTELLLSCTVIYFVLTFQKNEWSLKKNIYTIFFLITLFIGLGLGITFGVRPELCPGHF